MCVRQLLLNEYATGMLCYEKFTRQRVNLGGGESCCPLCPYIAVCVVFSSDNSGGFRLGPGGTGSPNLAQAPQIFDWFRSALFLLEGFYGPEICLECVGGRGFDPDPAGGVHDAPRSPTRLGRGCPPRTPRLSAPRSSCFQRSALAARRHVSSVYPSNFLAIHH